MAKPKKLSRADVCKQIDAFRGIVKQNADSKLSAEQWTETKRAESEERREANSKPMAKAPSRQNPVELLLSAGTAR